MKKEEAINILKEFIDTYITCHGEEDIIAVSIDNVDVEAFHMAIKALEQEPILDKIRAEILEDCGYSKDYVGAFTYSTIKVANVLQIIDKYKAESEDKE